MILDRKTVVAGLILAIMILTGLLGCGGGMTMKVYGSAEEQYRNSMGEYNKKHYLKAIDGFQKLIYNFSGAPMVDSAQYYLALSYFQQKDYYMAAAEFDRLAKTYPGSPFVDNSQYMAGLCYYKSSPNNYGLDQSELIKAIATLEDFITDYPESDAVEDARTALAAARERLAEKRYNNGRLYLRLGYYKSADIYFQAVIDEHTDSKWAARSLFYQGELNFKWKKYNEAKEKFNNFLVVYPEHELSKSAGKMLAQIDQKLAESTEEK